MATSNVLIVGVKGLGVEIGKRLATIIVTNRCLTRWSLDTIFSQEHCLGRCQVGYSI